MKSCVARALKENRGRYRGKKKTAERKGVRVKKDEEKKGVRTAASKLSFDPVRRGA